MSLLGPRWKGDGDARHVDAGYGWAGGLEDGCERMMDGVWWKEWSS